MKRAGLGVMGLVLAGLISGCVPAPLRAQAGAELRVTAAPGTPAVQTVTGAVGLYREPGPGSLRVVTDRAAFVTSVVLPERGGAVVLPAVRTEAGVTVVTSLPATSGYTQVFTVASLQPMALDGARGATSVAEVSRAVEAAARTLPAGAYTVATTVYRVERFGTLNVTANLAGAEVRINGERVGTAPLQVQDLPEGQVTVEVSRSGYRTFTQRVNITGNEVSSVNASLRLITGTLSVRSDVLADLYVERQLIGTVQPGVGLDLPLRPGVLSLNVVPRNRALASQNLLVRVTADRVTPVVCAVTNGEYRCTLP
ncbi:PEGA domain-containing protein [Deinococcus taeanensis]|uniref:PEGA domain-containing protein n=1 Tax=Deinococcus taeanensis TaxID=2737050 RepID=UPI001CDC6BCC|nr:PEGA domain-containing protein [Deinococcus taeanensis]UBV41899.1 PEGA domain-containing protein [Deinococcus taeanensis]